MGQVFVVARLCAANAEHRRLDDDLQQQPWPSHRLRPLRANSNGVVESSAARHSVGRCIWIALAQEALHDAVAAAKSRRDEGPMSSALIGRAVGRAIRKHVQIRPHR